MYHNAVGLKPRVGRFRWQDALEQRKQLEEALSRCLLARRTAFRLFKQQYWDSFQPETQRMLRDMLGITDAAISSPAPSSPTSSLASPMHSPPRYRPPGMSPARSQKSSLRLRMLEAMQSGTPMHPTPSPLSLSVPAISSAGAPLAEDAGSMDISSQAQQKQAFCITQSSVATKLESLTSVSAVNTTTSEQFTIKSHWGNDSRYVNPSYSPGSEQG